MGLKIEVGKYYKTDDGRKVRFPVIEHDQFGFKEVEPPRTVNIVSEWDEQPDTSTEVSEQKPTSNEVSESRPTSNEVELYIATWSQVHPTIHDKKSFDAISKGSYADKWYKIRAERVE
jgi:hypothetical protein